VALEARAHRGPSLAVRRALSGLDPVDAAETTNAPERVEEYAEAWLTRRRTQGIAKVSIERGTLKHHALDAIGALPLCDVTPSHIAASSTTQQGRA
jgi:hypothetical protein